MIARLDALSAAQYRMPDHHPLIIARRHHTACDRPARVRPAAVEISLLAGRHAALETLCQYRISNFVEDFDDLLLLVWTEHVPEVQRVRRCELIPRS